MSIVAVHGPSMITSSGGGGAGAVTEAPQVRAVADMSNGWVFNFSATDTSRAAADYDWAFPGGTPATATDSQGPITVTYASAGAKTATLTVAAGAGPPAGGAYPITVTAVGAAAGTPRLAKKGAEPEEDAEEEIARDEAEAHGYDPGEYTVDDVKEYADEHPDEVETVLGQEIAGKNRSTLTAYLTSLLPYDPADWTVGDVQEYAEENPDQVADILASEKAGKNRTTLVSFLEELAE